MNLIKKQFETRDAKGSSFSYLLCRRTAEDRNFNYQPQFNFFDMNMDTIYKTKEYLSNRFLNRSFDYGDFNWTMMGTMHRTTFRMI